MSPPICDYEDEFSRTGAIGSAGQSKQSIVGNAGVVILGGRVKDAGVGYTKDWGAGEPLHPYVRTVDALVGATGGVQVDIVACDLPDGTGNAVVLSTITILAAAFVANAVHQMPALKAGTNRRCLVAKFTPLATNSTAGSLILGFLDKTGRPQDGVNYL